jgi:hypothetical protein
MRFIGIIAAICAALFAGSVFWGCESGPAVAESSLQPEAESESDSMSAPQILSPPPVDSAALAFTLRPIDGQIVYQVIEGGDSLKQLQYYISETVTLTQENVRQNIEIREGSGLRRELSEKGQIVIRKETGGVLVNTFFDTDQMRILVVSFDETSDTNTLFFREDTALNRFILMYDTKSLLTGYGEQKYHLQFTGDVPHLLIRFGEEKTSAPSERVVRGRFIGTNK